jgi:hypothetical protein
MIENFSLAYIESLTSSNERINFVQKIINLTKDKYYESCLNKSSNFDDNEDFNNGQGDGNFNYNYSNYGNDSDFNNNFNNTDYNFNYDYSNGSSPFPGFDPSNFNGSNGSMPFPGDMSSNPCDYYPYNRDPNNPLNALIYQMMSGFSQMGNFTDPAAPQQGNNTGVQPGMGGPTQGSNGTNFIPGVNSTDIFINMPC